MTYDNLLQPRTINFPWSIQSVGHVREASVPVQPGLMTHATLNLSSSVAHFMVTWSALYPGVVSKQLWAPSHLFTAPDDPRK